MRSALSFIVVAALAAACADDTMTRKVSLIAKPFLARGESTVLGAYAHVYTCGLQPLLDTSSYVAWLVTAGEATPLGRLSAASNPSVVALPASFTPSAAAELIVTEETGRTSYPASPSQLVRLSGPLGGQLGYAPMCAECMNGVTGSADIADAWIEVMAMSAPALPAGLSYGVWATWAAPAATPSGDDSMPGMQMALAGGPFYSPGHGTATPSGGGACSYAAPSATDADGPERLFVGELDETGMLTLTAPRSLVTLSELVVTIESRRAAPNAMSPVAALRGVIELPIATESIAHSH